MARSRASSVSPAFPAATDDRARPRSPAMALLRSLRPNQWSKNVFVFAGLIFGSRLLDFHADLVAFEAFAVFCALSSVVYLVNDLKDREADARHPTKCRRPIACGDLAPETATIAAVVLACVALLASWTIGVSFAAVGAIYLALTTAYTMWLKHVVILDVLTLASGFVLRAIAGAVAISVPFSSWLLLMVLLGALFIGLSKRRAELVTLAADASGHRRILAEYTPYLLDQMISVVTASTLVAYAFYTTDPDTARRFGTRWLFVTVPFIIYGIFRYLYLVHQRADGGNPSELLVTDRPLLACVALWGIAVVIILYGPWR